MQQRARTQQLPQRLQSGRPSKDELYVGYSQADLASTWRTVESEDMQRAADERGYKITIVNAEGDSEQQLSDVESLLDRDVT